MMHWVGMKGKKMVTIDIMGGCLVDRTCKHVYGTKNTSTGVSVMGRKYHLHFVFLVTRFCSDSYNCSRGKAPSDSMLKRISQLSDVTTHEIQRR